MNLRKNKGENEVYSHKLTNLIYQITSNLIYQIYLMKLCIYKRSKLVKRYTA